MTEHWKNHRPVCPAAVPEREERAPVVGIAMLVVVCGSLLTGLLLAIMMIFSEVMFALEHGL